jgi:hypothetical protein
LDAAVPAFLPVVSPPGFFAIGHLVSAGVSAHRFDHLLPQPVDVVFGMSRYVQLIEGEDGWTDWHQPNHTDYKLACCDCGLIHKMQFRVVKGQVEFRASRDERATAARRRHMTHKHNG